MSVKKTQRRRIGFTIAGVEQITNPELVFGVVGPIGTDLEAVIASLIGALQDVNYQHKLIHLTQHMQAPKVRTKIDTSSYFDRYMSLIEYANEYRRIANDPAALAGLSLIRIMKARSEVSTSIAEPALGSDAARLGRSVVGSTMYCTTFPCHLCAKHIVASGINRLVFLEPYPKSYAKKLHGDSITFDPVETEKVLFQAFIGISPRRYRDIFEKKKRKDAQGKGQLWNEGRPIPRIEDRSGAYIENEGPLAVAALGTLFSDARRK